VDGKPVYAYEDSPVNTGRIPGTTNFVPVNPMPITRQLMERGQQRFQINCSPCHGPDGDGKGITSKYGMIGMANFHDKRLIDMADGEIFNTITHGKNLMGAYGANVEVEDRWAIIAYVRALQRSQLATADDVPEPNRWPFKK
jgi:mono/diheme cytochrome c family protein